MPNPIKNSPVTTVTSIEATVLTGSAWLVAHGYIPADVAKQAGPWVVLAAVVAAGAVKWWHVMPWAHGQELVDQLSDGRLTDADLERMLAGVADIVHGDAALDQQATGDAHPDAAAVGEPAAPTLSAGAPARGVVTTTSTPKHGQEG